MARPIRIWNLWTCSGRIALGVVVVCGVVFVTYLINALFSGYGLLDAVSLAFLMTVYWVVTPLSLITTGHFPAMDL